MARLRYNGLTATLGADLLTAGTTITFAAALAYEDGAVPTLASGDYLALVLMDADGNPEEIVHLTAYTSGATTGTVTRAQESTTATDHAAGAKVVHGPTAADFTSSGSSGGAGTLTRAIVNTLSLSLTSTTWVDVTGLSGSFTVPADGTVRVRVDGAMIVDSASSLELAVHDGTANVTGSVRRVARPSGAYPEFFQGTFTYVFLWNGLTPGATKNIQITARRGDGTNQVLLTADTASVWGQLIMEVDSSPLV